VSLQGFQIRRTGGGGGEEEDCTERDDDDDDGDKQEKAEGQMKFYRAITLVGFLCNSYIHSKCNVNESKM
jgi:hypothetical protein